MHQELDGSSQSRRRTPVIGLVLGVDDLERRPWMVAILQATVRAADRQGLGLVTVIDCSRPSAAIRNLVSDGVISGVLVRAGTIDQPWVEEVLDVGVPTVLIGPHERRPDILTVDTENTESSALLVGAMLDAGAERVAMITGRDLALDSARRLEGFELAHDRRGRRFDPALVVKGDFTPETGHRLAGDLVEAGADAIFCANDDTAIGVLHRLHEMGVVVPDQVMVAGFDGTLANHYRALHFLHPDAELASARPDYDRLAETAVEELRLLVSGMELPRERLVEPTVSLGTTIRPPLDSSAVSSPALVDRA